MKDSQFLQRLIRLSVLPVLVAIPTITSAHDEVSSTLDCHVVDSDQEDNDECHCHVPGEDPVLVSCDDDLLNMELLLDLDKVDEELFFGLKVEPEDTCAEYNTAEYPYGTTLDVIKSNELGGIFGAYENRCFDTYKDVDVEHLVAKKEAHDSGLCAADAQTKINFTNDLENIALASSTVNRSKGARDPAEWLPEHSVCWYVWQVLHIKRKYDLTIDDDEKTAIEEVLQDCAIEDLVLEIDESCTLPENANSSLE